MARHAERAQVYSCDHRRLKSIGLVEAWELVKDGQATRLTSNDDLKRGKPLAIMLKSREVEYRVMSGITLSEMEANAAGAAGLAERRHGKRGRLGNFVDRAMTKIEVWPEIGDNLAVRVGPRVAGIGVLTKKTLEAARNACAGATAAGKLKSVADKERDAAVGQVFFELGFANMDAAKALCPEEMAIAIKNAIGVDCELEAAAAGLFAIVKTSEGRYPMWKEEFQAMLGPAEVGRVEGETAKQYSYAVVDAADAKAGAIPLGAPLGAQSGKAVKAAKK